MMYEQMKLEYEQLSKRIAELEHILQSSPSGKLICAKDRSGSKWYLRNGKEFKYLPKNHKTQARALAVKKYQSSLLSDLSNEMDAVGAYLTTHDTYSSKSLPLLEKESPYHELLSPYFQSTSAIIEEWASAPYPHNPKHPEQLIHKTFTGNTVRSKSETIIDSALYLNRIPYRYECALELDSVTFYPDFTILHPITGQIYYWEHFGMMDNDMYARNAYSKLNTFNEHGIIPSLNLITTYETKAHPLTSDMVEKMIQLYLP